MKIHIKKLFALSTAFIVGLCTLNAQNKEYDDLYFTPDDRLTVKKVDAEDRVVQDAKEVQQLTADPTFNYSAKNINPEFIARYQAPSDEYTGAGEYVEGEYFNEDYDYNNDNDSYATNANNYHDADVVVRDRYGNTSYFRDISDVYWSDPFYYEGSIFDPFYSPYRYGFSRFGYRHGYRPFRSGWSLSFGFGNHWGHGWHSGFGFGYGWNSGFYDPFYASYYDPFYSPYYGSYYGSYYGYGYPYRNNVVVINNYESRSDRTIRRTPSTSRSSRIAVSDRTRRVQNDNENISTGRSATSSRVANISRSRDYTNSRVSTRDNSDAQSRFYRRSREAAVTNNNEATTSRTYDSRARSSSNYNSGSSDNRGRTYSRPSSDNNRYSSESNSRRSTYSTPSRTRSSSYSNSSRSRSSSYSTPSRSRSSYSAPSRSRSSSSYSSGSSSRSSGTRSSIGRSRRGN